MGSIKICILLGAFLLTFTNVRAQGISCKALFDPSSVHRVSFNEVVQVMESGPYDPNHLPVLPLQIFRWVGQRVTFFVGERSKEILSEKKEYRVVGLPKPIHSMGVGLIGKVQMMESRWSGIFRGGEFPAIARASISQDNPFKTQSNGEPQKRSTALALKILANKESDEKSETANAVFQNNLNGLIGADQKAINYLESIQTNQPELDFSKISRLYEVETLIGVAFGALSSSHDKMSKFPFINPQIRPVHSMAEFGEADVSAVRTPIWVKIVPRVPGAPVEASDFRLEIFKTIQRDSKIQFEIYAADVRDSIGRIQWEKVGVMEFDRAILSQGVDQNLLFPHDTLNSSKTGEIFRIPDPSKQFDSVPQDIQ